MHARLALLSVLVTCSLSGAAPEYPKMGPDIYDPKADGQAQITTALAKAAAGDKHVLLMFGANWCIWCHRLHATFTKDPDVAKFLRERFEVVLIDVNSRHGTKRNAGVNTRYGNPIANGLPVLVVLDRNGKLLTTQETGALEDGEKHSPKKVLAFLERWAPKR